MEDSEGARDDCHSPTEGCSIFSGINPRLTKRTIYFFLKQEKKMFFHSFPMSLIGGFSFTVKKNLGSYSNTMAHIGYIGWAGRMPLGLICWLRLLLTSSQTEHGDEIGFPLASREERFLPALLLSLRPFSDGKCQYEIASNALASKMEIFLEYS